MKWSLFSKKLHGSRVKRTAGLAAVSAAFALFVWIVVGAGQAPSFQDVRSEYRTSEGLLLDRDQRPLHQIRVETDGRRLNWCPLTSLSPALVEAIVAAEDRRFYEHRGLDWKAVLSAGWGALRTGNVRGASTLTMQVAAQLDPALAPRKGRRSVPQKIRQVVRARLLEANWTKEQILEAYLNLSSFRGELQGIGAASRGLFGKEPHGIDRREALLLASLLRSPNAGIESVVARALALAARLRWTVDSDAVRLEAGRALAGLYFVSPTASYAPHAASRLLGSSAGKPVGERPEKVVSTLDLDLQLFATEALRNRLASLRNRNVRDGAVMVVENATGDVLGYLGNDGQGTTARYVDGTMARRQAGSILKPFLYALAFDLRLLTPASLVDDSPLEMPAPGGVYRPRNYDDHFNGLVSARQALASSLNVPAVRTLNLVGIDAFLALLRGMGFSSLESADYYGPSLALGSADISLGELVDAYRALANAGLYQPSRLTPDEQRSAPVQVLSPEAAFLVADILSDRESREMTFGLENPLASRFWTAVKTGTSKDMRDNWCVGFSQHYTVGIWVGNFSGEPMWHVSGVTGAAPLWLEIMTFLHRGLPSRPAPPPSGLESRTVYLPHLGSSYDEWFLEGTGTDIIETGRTSAGTSISYPVNGTILALDPDIPANRQVVFFESSPEVSANAILWKLNGKTLERGGSRVKWIPRVGRHRLELVDKSGRQQDAVDFEVRR